MPDDKRPQKRQINVKIEEELLDWFEDFYPQYGAKTWFFNEALREFKKRHDVSPQDKTRRAVRQLMD